MTQQNTQNWQHRVNTLLETCGWSQSRLALRLRCTTQTVNRWATGKADPKAYRVGLEQLEREKGLLNNDDG